MVILLFVTGCNTGGSSNNSQNQNSQSESIVLKNKSSPDARKDLGQLGIDFSEENFYLYASRGDKLATGLFIAAGMDSSPGLVGATYGNQTAIAKELLTLGANPNATFKTLGQFTNTKCSSALEFAVFNNNTDLVKELISKGATVDFSEGCALQAAIISGSTESAQLLLDAGAKADTTTVDFAISNKQGKIVKLLINKGIKVDLITLAEKAISAADYSTLEFVIDSGLDPNAKTTIEAPYDNRYTLLMSAVRRESPELVKTLLSKGADPNLCIVLERAGLSRTKGDICPISMAMSRNGASEIVGILKDAGAICNPVTTLFIETFLCEPSNSRKKLSNTVKETPQLSQTSSDITSDFPKSSCGDNLPVNPQAYPVKFYPVYVEFNDARLSQIKQNFCKDALLKTLKNTNKKVIQVGSFTDIKRAITFKELMLKQFNSGEIGEVRVISAKP